MTTQEIAERLVELCRKGDYDTAENELYHPSIESHEAPGVPNSPIIGLDMVKKVGQEMMSNIETIHASTCSDPIVIKDHFTVSMSLDVSKKTGERVLEEEICVFKVEKGKIVEARFFYSMI